MGLDRPAHWRGWGAALSAVRAYSGRGTVRLYIWVGTFVHFYFSGDHRRFSGALLRAFRGSRAYHGGVHHQSRYSWVVPAQPARVWRERHGHRVAAEPFANLYLRGLQRSTRNTM